MTNRRSFLLGAATAALLVSLPTPAFAELPGSVAEKTIAAALNSAAIRQKFTPKETWDIATRLGVTLESAAPRATPWLKLIAKASPIGRVITIVGAVAMAYDVVKDLWNIAPRRTTQKGTYDGSTTAEICPIGQTCKYTDANGTFYIIQTRETSASQSLWTYYGTYSVLKNVSLGSSQKPFVYQVYWKVGTPDLPRVMDPIPADQNEKKQTVAPGNLQEYLQQFADEAPDPVGLTQSLNDMLDHMYSTNGAGLRTGLQAIADDVAKAIAGIGTKVRDWLDDSAYDRAPQFAIDPTTGIPNPDPGTNTGTIPGAGPGTSTNTGGGTAPGTGTGTSTGTGTGTGECLPGSSSCPAEVNWGDAPTVPDLSEVTPNPFIPSQQTLSDLPTGQCPTIDFTFMQKHIVVDGHCAVLESKRSMIWTLGNITGMLGAFRILMGG